VVDQLPKDVHGSEARMIVHRRGPCSPARILWIAGVSQWQTRMLVNYVL
jgi:hypothetical protein